MRSIDAGKTPDQKKNTMVPKILFLCRRARRRPFVQTTHTYDTQVTVAFDCAKRVRWIGGGGGGGGEIEVRCGYDIGGYVGGLHIDNGTL